MPASPEMTRRTGPGHWSVQQPSVDHLRHRRAECRGRPVSPETRPRREPTATPAQPLGQPVIGSRGVRLVPGKMHQPAPGPAPPTRSSAGPRCGWDATVRRGDGRMAAGGRGLGTAEQHPGAPGIEIVEAFARSCHPRPPSAGTATDSIQLKRPAAPRRRHRADPPPPPDRARSAADGPRRSGERAGPAGPAGPSGLAGGLRQRGEGDDVVGVAGTAPDQLPAAGDQPQRRRPAVAVDPVGGQGRLRGSIPPSRPGTPPPAGRPGSPRSGRRVELAQVVEDRRPVFESRGRR